ncbi:MAG: hypothetical protein WCX31_05570 [Salinivirgaceae bacterium]
MKTTIVKIGNSQGLIIPKKLLSTLGESKRVDIQVKESGLLIKSLTDNKARTNWENLFTDAITKGFVPDGEILEVENEFDKKEWTW